MIRSSVDTDVDWNFEVNSLESGVLDVVVSETAGDWRSSGDSEGQTPPTLKWCEALVQGLRYRPYVCAARRDGRVVGTLPLALVSTRLFGRFLVSLPYINSAGVVADDEDTVRALIDRAVQLADDLDVDHLQLRHEREWQHPKLTQTIRSKVITRQQMPETPDELWKSFTPKVRNQVRKGEKSELTVHWGRHDLLPEFYSVFAHNMRDLGTPVFSRRLFRSILDVFADKAELCVVRKDSQPLAAGLLVHGEGRTEVPSASSLREFRKLNANMLLYWHLLKRTIERGNQEFDFGRSTTGSSSEKFKLQWGGQSYPSYWQYYVRRGSVDDMRPDNDKYSRAIKMWQKLPVWFTKIIGPPIVRGIP